MVTFCFKSKIELVVHLTLNVKFQCRLFVISLMHLSLSCRTFSLHERHLCCHNDGSWLRNGFILGSSQTAQSNETTKSFIRSNRLIKKEFLATWKLLCRWLILLCFWQALSHALKKGRLQPDPWLYIKLFIMGCLSLGMSSNFPSKALFFLHWDHENIPNDILGML